jgi:hypothetical protein
MTEATRNQGEAPVPRATRTRYYLSGDETRNAGDRLMTGTRLVPALAPGTASSGGVNVTVPGNTAPGLYYLLACADDTTLVDEVAEGNNCEASSTRVDVRP